MSQSTSASRPKNDPVATFVTSMFESNEYFIHAFDDVCIASREVWFFMTDEERQPFREASPWYQGASYIRGADGSMQPFRADADLVLRVAKVVRQRQENRKEAAQTDALVTKMQAELVAESVEGAESVGAAESVAATESVADICDLSELAEGDIGSSNVLTEAVDEQIAKRLDRIEFLCKRDRAWKERLERERVRLEDYDDTPMWCQMTTDSGQLSSNTSEAGSSQTGSSQTGSSRSGLTQAQKRRRRRSRTKASMRARSEGAETPFVVGVWSPESLGLDRGLSGTLNERRTKENVKIADNCIFKGMTHWSNDMLYTR